MSPIEPTSLFSTRENVVYAINTMINDLTAWSTVYIQGGPKK